MKLGPFLPIVSLLLLVFASGSTEETSPRQSTATGSYSALTQVPSWSQQS